jgi:hypothetical protein
VTTEIEGGTEWLAVIGRALAVLSLRAVGLEDKEVGEKAEFLFSLGLTRDEIAPLVGSTPDSIRVLTRLRRKKKKGGNAKKKTKRAR